MNINTNLIDLLTPPLPAGGISRLWDYAPAQMQVDVKEDAKSYVITADVPGVSRDNLQVELDNNVLTISTSVNESKTTGDTEAKDADERFILRERYSGRFSRSFKFCQRVDKDSIDAKLDEGILEVKITKPDPEVVQQEKTIAIK